MALSDMVGKLFGRNGTADGAARNRLLTAQAQPLLGPSGRRIEAQQVIREDDEAIPPIMTYAGIIGLAYRTYVQDRWDESLKHDREDALVMRRDGWLMALLRERCDEVVRRKWHLEVEDDRDPVQVQVRDAIQKVIQRTPYMRKYIRSLLQDRWYGRYACQNVYTWDQIDGERVLRVRRWTPVNGDKLAFKFDGTPAVMVNSSIQESLYGPDARFVDTGPDTEFTMTTIGRALVLAGTWRHRFVISKHEIDDGDYFDPESAPSIHGVGIRHRVFWLDWMRREFVGWVVTYMERVGQGLTIWFYDDGNPNAKLEAEAAAKAQSNRMNIVWPRGRGANSGSGIERIETPVAGVDVLLRMQEALEDKIERYIIGQKMSADHTGSGGLGGSGAADFQADTKKAIGDDDAASIAEALTGSQDDPGLVWIIKQASFPWADFPVTFAFEEDPVDPEKALAAAQVVYGMGLPLVAEEVYSVAGFSKPGPEDEVVSMIQTQMQAAEAQQAAMMGGIGQPGPEPGGSGDPAFDAMMGGGQGGGEQSPDEAILQRAGGE